MITVTVLNIVQLGKNHVLLKETELWNRCVVANFRKKYAEYCRESPLCVNLINSAILVSVGFYTHERSSNAYILFYQRTTRRDVVQRRHENQNHQGLKLPPIGGSASLVTRTYVN